MPQHPPSSSPTSTAELSCWQQWWKSVVKLCTDYPSLVLPTISLFWMFGTGMVQKYIGSTWKRLLVIWIVSSLYLGWIYGVDYNYQPLSERELGLNVIYSVHKPFLNNIWYSASYHNGTSQFPSAFSVLDCVNISCLGYFTYFLNGWFGSVLTFPLLMILGIPVPPFLLYDMIASGRKYNFQGFFPTISYYSIMVALLVGCYNAIAVENTYKPEALMSFSLAGLKKFLQI